jgi:hypothetical protein
MSENENHKHRRETLLCFVVALLSGCGGRVDAPESSASSGSAPSPNRTTPPSDDGGTNPVMVTPTTFDGGARPGPVNPTFDGGSSGVPMQPSPTQVSLTVQAPSTSVQPLDTSSSGGLCLCTRRDPNPAGMCPRGVEQSTTMTIGPAGGKVSLAGQQGEFVLTIPATALASPTSITITETSIAPPPGFVDDSPVYRLDPVDLTFSAPSALSIPFSNGRGSYAADQNLAIFWSASATSPLTLIRLPSSSVNAGFMQGSTVRGGYAIVGYGSPGVVPYCN